MPVGEAHTLDYILQLVATGHAQKSQFTPSGNLLALWGRISTRIPAIQSHEAGSTRVTNAMTGEVIDDWKITSRRDWIISDPSRRSLSRQLYRCLFQGAGMGLGRRRRRGV